MTIQEIQAFTAAGFSFIPCGNDKRPVIKWLDYQYRRPDKYEIAEIPYQDHDNVAIIAGDVSGGVECIDFDTKNDPKGTIWKEFVTKAKQEKKTANILKKCFIQQTRSGGKHIVYKTPKAGRNQILALPKESDKPIIETRGQGGYFLVMPSPGYTAISGDLFNLETLEDKDREDILDLCKSLSRKPKVAATNGTHKPTTPSGTAKQDVENIIEQIEEHKIDITTTYNDWLKVGFALAKQFGEGGRDYYHRISQFWSGKDERGMPTHYDINQTNKKYDSCLLGRGTRSHVTIKTFFYIASLYGIYVDRDESPLTTHVRSLNLRYNLITKKVEDKYGNPINDRWLYSTWIKCREIKEIGKISWHLFNATVFSDAVPEYNPITDYFDNLTKITPDPTIIDRFLSHLKIKEKEIDMYPYIKRWLRSVVGAAYGYISDMVLVLIGPQGFGKGQFFERLLPLPLKNYAVISNLDSKEAQRIMCEKLIVIDDEFAGKNKRDARHFKSIVSQRFFTLRLPYGRVMQDLPRLCVHCGASNLEDILNDNTGNRRIIPVEVIDRDYSISDAIDRDQLWAALIHEFWEAVKNKDHKKYMMARDEYKEINTLSDDYQAANIERDLITKHLIKGGEGDDFMTTGDICDFLNDRTKQQYWPAKLGQELSLLGFKKARKRINGMQVRGWLVRDAKHGEKEDLPF